MVPAKPKSKAKATPAPKEAPEGQEPDKAEDDTAADDAAEPAAETEEASEEQRKDKGPKPPGRQMPKPKAKKKGGKRGTVFTMAHPATWDMSDLIKALAKNQVKAVHDARPNPEAGPAVEALKVAFASDKITYDREPTLSAVYSKLLDQARGIAEEGSKPCVLLDGRVGWRLKQYRNCINQYMKTKSIEVRHLLWSGEVDQEATGKAEEEVKREVPQKPDPPKFPVPAVAKKAPNVMAPTSKAPSITMTPTPKALMGGIGSIGGMTAPTSKASGLTPPTSKAPSLPLKSVPKGAPTPLRPAEASPKAAGSTESLLKPKPKSSSAAAAEEPGDFMKPRPKGGGTPTAKASAEKREAEDKEKPDAKKPKTEEADSKEATVIKKWAKKPSADAS